MMYDAPKKIFSNPIEATIIEQIAFANKFPNAINFKSLKLLQNFNNENSEQSVRVLLQRVFAFIKKRLPFYFSHF